MTMTTINTQDLIGPALDWAVAHAEGYTHTIKHNGVEYVDTSGVSYGGVGQQDWTPSTDPAQGHPIIERDRISLQHLGPSVGWGARRPAWVPDGDGETIPAASGPTMLIAGLRCLVAARIGPTVDVPQELLP